MSDRLIVPTGMSRRHFLGRHVLDVTQQQEVVAVDFARARVGLKVGWPHAQDELVEARSKLRELGADFALDEGPRSAPAAKQATGSAQRGPRARRGFVSVTQCPGS